MKEVDLYKPLKSFLTKKGYHVYSEIEGVDVIARRNEELLIVEMKLSFNLQLIYQLVERLKMSGKVYAYVPLTKEGRWAKSFKKMCALLRRLHCGLMTYDRSVKGKVVIEFEPADFRRRTNYQKKNSALREIDGRSLDLNEGGTSKELIFTAYKEKAIRVAMYLFEHGATSTQIVKENLQIKNATSILYDNYYDWFERVSRGVYQLTPEFEFFRLKYESKIKQLWRQ